MSDVKFTNEQLAGQVEQEIRQRHGSARDGGWVGKRTKLVIENLAQALIDRGVTKNEAFELIDEVVLYMMKE